MKQAIVIFGSTGNLMYKKLIPALDRLVREERIDDGTSVYCIGRRDWTTEDYLEDARNQVEKHVDWDRLAPQLSYVRFDIDNLDNYRELQDTMTQDDVTDVMVYLAVPPQLFPAIAKGVSQAGIVTKGDEHARIVFEKPFGEDLASAKEINRDLWQYFDESQIYRIDHYLGKEMIQNILIVRFANKIFEDSWNHDTIEDVYIIAKEEEGVMTRGGYYDEIGALKDMLQSHLLQMASLVAMEKPDTYSSEGIKNEKVKVFQDIKIRPKDVILGQYDGYLDAVKVAADSTTETFVFAEASINNDRWKGVPFYFLTGKKLDEKRSEIIVNFKNDNGAMSLWPDTYKPKNQLIIKVAPDDGVKFQFNVKEPGLSDNIVPAELDYCHSCHSLENTPEAYEKLLLDLINKNRTLFTRWDEIESTWRIVEQLKEKLDKPHTYASYAQMKQLISTRFGEDFDDL